MITFDQLQAMSDFEVNKALAQIVMLVLKKETWTLNNDKDTVWFFNETTEKSRVVDYCNTPNDIMPLAFEHRISLIENDDGYTAYHKFSIYEDINYRIEHGAYFGDANPLRAITCCLILVLQEKQK